MNTQSRPQKEHVLRDHLANNLDLIETGLTLIEVEYALPNSEGARGSIDILARDRSGYYVIIELKRADQTARQALHELNKYVSLIASHAGVRPDQLRCILLSTTWHELRVPFARFATDASFHTLALQLEVDDAGYPTGVKPVVLPDVAPGLETCPKHISLLYTDDTVRDTRVEILQSTLRELEVADYFVLKMDYRGSSQAVIYPHCLYVVFAEFSQDFRAKVADTYLAEEEEEEEEEELDPADWAEEEALQSALIERVPWDTAEIGTPDRLKASEGWTVAQTIRGGAYIAPLWSDEDLLGLASAHGGKYSAEFRRQIQVANRPAWARMLSDIQYCLTGADPWPEVVDALFAEIALRPNAEVLINAYSPCDLIWGLAHLVRTGGDKSYMPEINIALKDGDESRLYHGELMWDGQGKPQTLEDVFGNLDPTNNVFDYFMIRTAFGTWDIDSELCARHGLRYRLFEFFPDPDGHTFRLSVKNGGIVRDEEHIGESEDIRPWPEFYEANREYLHKLVEALDSMMLNIM